MDKTLCLQLCTGWWRHRVDVVRAFHEDAALRVRANTSLTVPWRNPQGMIDGLSAAMIGNSTETLKYLLGRMDPRQVAAALRRKLDTTAHNTIVGWLVETVKPTAAGTILLVASYSTHPTILAEVRHLL